MLDESMRGGQGYCAIVAEGDEEGLEEQGAEGEGAEYEEAKEDEAAAIGLPSYRVRSQRAKWRFLAGEYVL